MEYDIDLDVYICRNHKQLKVSGTRKALVKCVQKQDKIMNIALKPVKAHKKKAAHC